jgi:hypothetical protein
MILTLDVRHQLAAKFAAPRTSVSFMSSLGSAYETTCRRSAQCRADRAALSVGLSIPVIGAGVGLDRGASPPNTVLVGGSGFAGAGALLGGALRGAQRPPAYNDARAPLRVSRRGTRRRGVGWDRRTSSEVVANLVAPARVVKGANTFGPPCSPPTPTKRAANG